MYVSIEHASSMLSTSSPMSFAIEAMGSESIGL